MDVLRARAYLDILLGKDSRPRQDTREQDDAGPGGTAAGRQDGRQRAGAAGQPAAGLGGRGAGRVRREGDPDGAADHRAGPGRAARRDLRDRPHRPGPGPRPGRRGRPQPQDDVVRDRDRRARARHRARLRPARTQGPQETRRDQRRRADRTGNRDGPGFAFTATGQEGPPGGYGTWRLRTPGNGPDLLVTLDPIPAGDCDHRFQARGHDPGVKLRHLTQVRNATCTGPVCRRPATQSDFEHNTPYEAGGRTCLCNGGPKCRHDHRLKQHPRWKAEQLPDGTVRWTTPSGRQYTSEPTRYPI